MSNGTRNDNREPRRNAQRPAWDHYSSHGLNSCSDNRLLAYRSGQALRIGDADPKHGVIPETYDLWHPVHECDAQPLLMVCAESESVVGQAEPQSDRGVPTVRARDIRMIYIVECGFHPVSPKGSKQVALVSNINSVMPSHAQRVK